MKRIQIILIVILFSIGSGEEKHNRFTGVSTKFKVVSFMELLELVSDINCIVNHPVQIDDDEDSFSSAEPVKITEFEKVYVLLSKGEMAIKPILEKLHSMGVVSSFDISDKKIVIVLNDKLHVSPHFILLDQPKKAKN